MRNSQDVFHLAIPCRDLDETQHFYVDLLGCKLARRYPTHLTLDFFGDQVVCHKDSNYEPPEKLTMYPRHFGINFRHLDDFERLHRLAKEREIPFFQERFCRYEGKIEEHLSFFLKDPSGNLVEFKHYLDPRMMY